MGLRSGGSLYARFQLNQLIYCAYNIPGTRYIGACNVKMNMILAEHRHTAVVAEMEIGILNWPENIAIFWKDYNLLENLAADLQI